MHILKIMSRMHASMFEEHDRGKAYADAQTLWTRRQRASSETFTIWAIHINHVNKYRDWVPKIHFGSGILAHQLSNSTKTHLSHNVHGGPFTHKILGNWKVASGCGPVQGCLAILQQPLQSLGYSMPSNSKYLCTLGSHAHNSHRGIRTWTTWFYSFLLRQS